MKLLATLGLRPTRAMLRQQAIEAAKASPTKAEDVVAGEAPKVGAPLARSGYDPSETPAAGRKLEVTWRYV